MQGLRAAPAEPVAKFNAYPTDWQYNITLLPGVPMLRDGTKLYATPPTSDAPAQWISVEDRKESAALYALATGVARPRWNIDQAVTRYTAERLPELKHGDAQERELEATRDWWTGRPIEELPAVCAEYAQDQHGALAPATVRNRLACLKAACRWAWNPHRPHRLTSSTSARCRPAHSR